MTTSARNASRSNSLKFIIGGGLFLVAVILMIISATQATAQFFLTVQEIEESAGDLIGKNLRVSGAVIGESIVYDSEEGFLHFKIAHIPQDESEIQAKGGIEAVLAQAVRDPNLPRLEITYEGVQPDMLKDEAQVILTGTLLEEGQFFAEELLLKCPTKYEEAVPDQVGE